MDCEDIGEVVVHVVEPVPGDDPVELLWLSPGDIHRVAGDVAEAHVQRLTGNWGKEIMEDLRVVLFPGYITAH